MSKKRNKSPANNAVNNSKWESNIVSAELNEGIWSYSLLFLVENIIEDKETIDYIKKGIQTGLRRKFSLLNSERLMDMILEYGGAKSKKGKDGPPNFEVCEHAKTYLDRGEKLPASVIARIIKWAMLTAKAEDSRDKVDSGKKIDGKGSKSKKTNEKADRSKSSAAKKGTQAAGKKSPEPPSVKVDTKLRKRGDPDPDIQFIDDEPDDGSSRYFVVTGISDPGVIEALAEIGCLVTSVVKITRDIHISHDNSDVTEAEGRKISVDSHKNEDIEAERDRQNEALRIFWANITGILNNSKSLFNTPILPLVAKHLMFPIDKENVELQDKCSMDLFEFVAVLMYDLLDLKRQWKNYLEKSKIIELPVKSVEEIKVETVAPVSARDEKAPSDDVQSKIEASTAATFDNVEMDYYRFLLQGVPIEDTSVFLQISAMLDQIDVTNGDKTADWNQPKLSGQNNINEEAMKMLNEMIDNLYLSKEDVQDLKENLQLTEGSADDSKMTKDNNMPLQALDGIALRDLNISSVHLGKEGSMIRELRMLITCFKQIDLLNVVPVDDLIARKRAARLQEFLKYMDNTGLSKIEINYAIKLFILESLVISGTDENGIMRVNDQDGLFPKNINQPWDDPFIVLDDAANSIIEEEHVARETKVDMFQNLTDTARDDQSVSGRSSYRSTEGILKSNRSPSHSSDGNRSSRRRSSVHFVDIEKNDLTGVVTEGELDVAGMLLDDQDENLQAILLDYLQNIRRRSFTEWCFEEFYEPHVMLQIIHEACYKLPFLDIYSERKTDGKVVVLHNPFQEKLRYNHQPWNQWLHANVGFRNYLDFINDKITDWTRDEEAIYQAMLLNKELETSEKPTEVESPKALPKKGADKGKKSKLSKSRSRSVSRSSSADESDSKEVMFVLPGSLKAQKLEQDKLMKTKEEEERKKEEKRLLSAQKKADKDAVKDKVKRPSSKTSNKSKGKRSVTDEVQDPVQLLTSESVKVESEEYWPFVGYDLGDNMAHFSGELAHLFPSDGCTIRVQKTQKLLDSTSVRVSIITPQSHVFSLHIIDPFSNTEEQIDNFEKVLEQLESQSTISRYGAATCVFNDGVCLASSNYGYSGCPDKNNLDQMAEMENSQSARIDENPGETNTDSIHDQAANDTAKGFVGLKKLVRDNVDMRDLQNIILTTPNGIQVRVGYESDENKQLPNLLLYLTKPELHCLSDAKKDQFQIVKEIGRYIMSDGRVISILNNDTIKVMFADGTIATTTLAEEIVISHEEESEEAKIEKANQRETPSQKKKKQPKVTSVDQVVVADNIVVGDRKEIINKTRNWVITRANGEVFETKGDLNVFDIAESVSKLTSNDFEMEESTNVVTEQLPQWKRYLQDSNQTDSQLISCATDPSTGETLVTRSDGTLLLTTRDSGIFLSEHADHTRFTKYFQYEKPIQPRNGKEDPDEPRIIEIIKIESENYPIITIDRTNGKIETRCGSMCTLVSVPDGSHCFKHSDGSEVEYRPDGEIIFTAAGHSQMAYLQPYGSSSYVLNTMSNIICEMQDTDGTEFIVNANGYYEVKKNVNEPSKIEPTSEPNENHPAKPTSAISGASVTNNSNKEGTVRKFDQHAPRIFFLNSDGSGSELLRYRDIVDTIVNAEVDSNYFQYKESIQDHPHIIGHTIMSSLSKQKPWKYEYARKTVIPKGLTCRDMKTFPTTEIDKNGPLFSMSIGKGLSINTNQTKTDLSKNSSTKLNSIKCSDALQFRQFYHYPLISDDIRNCFSSELVEYNKAILRQRQKYKDLEIWDDRSNEEQITAAEIKKKYFDMAHLNEQVLSNAMTALSNVEQSQELAKKENAEMSSNDNAVNSNNKRLSILLEKQRIEKEKEIENKYALKNHVVPNYFTSVYGKDFLTNQAVDLKTLNKSMKLFPVSREATARNVELENSAVPSDSGQNIEPEVMNDASIINERTKSEPSTTKESNNQTFLLKKKEKKYIYYDSSLIIPTLPKRMPVSTNLPLPRYLFSTRPSVEQNIKQATIEDPVRRKQLTASLIGGPPIGQIFQRQCRGLNVLPSRIDTGLLREGGRYAFKIKLINTGPESSSFKVKQPPSTSNIWVEFIPGPIAAGLSRHIIIHIYAIAKSIESTDSQVYVIDHPLNIITDTDILEIPITGRVMTAEKYDYMHPKNNASESGLSTITESFPTITADSKRLTVDPGKI